MSQQHIAPDAVESANQDMKQKRRMNFSDRGVTTEISEAIVFILLSIE